jgi:ribosomal protein S18 acetylase RimI-like enzyme
MYIEYHIADEKGLDLIRELWTELNHFHINKSVYFRHHYESMNFEARKGQLINITAKGSLHIDLAEDIEKNRTVGYCVSSVSAEKVGELESIYVGELYRRRGIGTILVRKALAWMDIMGVEKKRVSVSYGNEETWAFYRTFGLLPRMTVLEQVI